MTRPHLQGTQEKLVLGGVIAIRLGKRQSISWYLRKTQPKIVGLHFRIARTLFTRRILADPGQQTAALISGHYEGIHLSFELMRTGIPCLHATQSLSVLCI